MTHEAERAHYYRGMSAQMRAKGYGEHDPERRALYLQLAASYAEIADAWERIMPPAGGGDSNR
ncbi:MAG: hypothetical protein ACJ8EL_08580 [Rhizomicrobium sp.]|jgi:hypothetical protein